MSTLVSENLSVDVLKTLEDLKNGLLVGVVYGSEPTIVNLGTKIIQIDLPEARLLLSKLTEILGVLYEGSAQNNTNIYHL